MAEADQLNLTALTEGMVASSLLLGLRSEQFSEGDCRTITADVKILILAVLFFAATLGCTLAPNVSVMIISRFLLGLAVGEHP